MFLYLVYRTDIHHSQESRDLIAACTDVIEGVNCVIVEAINEGHPMDLEELEFLKTQLQTQNYTGIGEFVIDQIPANRLLTQPYRKFRKG